ncbi:MerR family transcriptional regulator [Mycolicibacillus trivialis]|uniref:MerR family transcriptional regulator n=1 Tax=Mycolicibacillus trivialis TaxID=1798 RepID=A0A1X2EQW3_9MYCO|nr:MerR family transcriptional regulator [Mycolicibacillus trivialis]ORX08545.1 MerR family transcriptional regulator [Mycolicibacillus trivialis]
MEHTQARGRGGWRVGELAELTGVTVRALRYYDQTGLLHPAGQTAGGHRLYDRDNVLRLYRILALRRLRFSLAEIRALLDEPQWDLAAMVARHAEETDRGIAAAARLSAHLRAISGEISGSGDASPETLFRIIEEMNMLDTPIRSTTTLLVYDDLPAAYAYLIDTFGLTGGSLEHGRDGRAVHGELFAGDQSIWLHPSGDGYRSPRELGGVSSMIVIAVEDADSHYDNTKEHGAVVLGPPVDQPYGVREYGARDLEGHLWFFHGPLR